ELLALAEPPELVRAARGDDRRHAFRLVARERRRRALLRRSVASLEEGEERIVERLAKPRAHAIALVGAHAPGDRDQRGHEARHEIEGEVARDYEEGEEDQRQLDGV